MRRGLWTVNAGLVGSLVAVASLLVPTTLLLRPSTGGAGGSILFAAASLLASVEQLALPNEPSSLGIVIPKDYDGDTLPLLRLIQQVRRLPPSSGLFMKPFAWAPSTGSRWSKPGY